MSPKFVPLISCTITFDQNFTFRDWSKSIGGGGVDRSREGVGHEGLSLVQGVGRAIFSYPQGVGHPIFY